MPGERDLERDEREAMLRAKGEAVIALENQGIRRQTSFEEGFRAALDYTQSRLTASEQECERLRDALRYLADPESWMGNPLNQEAVLYGHDTPFELARATLSYHQPDTPEEERDDADR